VKYYMWQFNQQISTHVFWFNSTFEMFYQTFIRQSNLKYVVVYSETRLLSFGLPNCKDKALYYWKVNSSSPHMLYLLRPKMCICNSLSWRNGKLISSKIVAPAISQITASSWTIDQNNIKVLQQVKSWNPLL
jgi:hypothetical protein